MRPQKAIFKMAGDAVACSCWGKVILGWIFSETLHGLWQSKYIFYSWLIQCRAHVFSCSSTDLLHRLSCSPSGKHLLHRGVSRGVSSAARAPPLPSPTWVPAGLISHTFYLMQFPSFSKMLSPALMMGSAMPCSGAAVEPVGTGCVGHRAAMPSPHRLPPTPGHGHPIHQVLSVWLPPKLLL